jgi:phage shock protein PspC (stress-responsive transcriptional regulator)
MTTTITVNISGNAFTMEEEAFQKLETYLKSIRNRIASASEADEVIADIEARIAELFRASCPSTREVVTLQMINEMIGIMGQPGDFGDDDAETVTGEAKSQSTINEPLSMPKKLYRDTSNQMIGGVCSGLAAYFNTDTSIMRLIFVIMLFAGITPFVYVVLWIAMPPAITMAQRSQMYGYTNYTSQGFSADASQPFNAPRRSSSNAFESVVYGFGRVIAFVIGLVLSLVAFVLLSVLCISLFYGHLFPTHLHPELAEIWNLPHLILPGSDYYVAATALLLVLGIPLLTLFYLGIRLLFNINHGPKWIGILLMVLWIGGLVLGVVTAINIGSQISNKSISRTEENIKVDGYQTIYLNPMNPEQADPAAHIGNSSIEWRVKGEPKIYIKESDVASIQVEEIFWGPESVKKNMAAELGTYHWQQTDSVIKLDNSYAITSNNNFKPREIKVTIHLPHQTKLVVNPELEKYIQENDK